MSTDGSIVSCVAGEQQANRRKVAWQPDIIRISLTKATPGRTLDQIATAARLLQQYWPKVDARPIGLQERPAREIWSELLAVVAAHDPQIAQRLSQWTAYDDVLDTLKHGPPRRERQWRFTRDVSCEIVTSGRGTPGVIVETQAGRHYQNYFNERATAIAHAKDLGDQIRQSGHWREDDTAT